MYLQLAYLLHQPIVTSTIDVYTYKKDTTPYRANRRQVHLKWNVDMAALLAHVKTRKVRKFQHLAFGSSEVVFHRLLTSIIQWEPVGAKDYILCIYSQTCSSTSYCYVL